VNELISTVFEIMGDMRQNLPSAENMEKSKETIIREMETDNEKNSYWIDKLMHTSINGDKLMTKEELTKIVGTISPEDIRQAARRYFTPDHYLQVVLLPEK